MSWARIDDQLAFHAKVLKAGNEAVGAWVRMLAHCCAHLTDGLVEREVALQIAPQRVIDRAMSARLLDVDGENYRVHDFHDWNPPAGIVLAKRESERARKAVGRAQQGRSPSGRITDGVPSSVRTDVRADSVRNPSVRPPVPSPVPVPVLDPPVAPHESETEIERTEDLHSVTRLRTGILNAHHDGAFGHVVAAWADGISSVTKKPFSSPNGAQLGTLLSALNAHCPRGHDREAWARHSGADYARSRPGKLWPSGYADWLNAPDASQASSAPDMSNPSRRLLKPLPRANGGPGNGNGAA